jgi:iron complex outermembrane receptor protein
MNFGAVANQYYGRHFGNVTGVFLPQIDEHEYYRNRSVKNEVSGFAKALVRMNDFEFFGDLQLRNVDYDTKIITAGDGEGADLNKNWLFFNPKAGINYKISAGKIFVSMLMRTANRTEMICWQTMK